MKNAQRIVTGLTMLFSLAFFAGCATTGTGKNAVNPAKSSGDTSSSFKGDLAQTSKTLLRPGTGENWKPDSALAREIQQHKIELAVLVEDANWILALNAALNGPLPEDVKNSLRLLHENYAEGAPHEDIAKQVEDLLPKIQDERFRKELKKLANRSWDRDQRLTPLVPNGGKGGLIVQPMAVGANGHSPPRSPPQQVVVKPDTATIKSAAADTSIEQSKNRVDSLTSHGFYLEALRALEMFEDKADASWVKNRRESLGNHYCEERRSYAANAFVASRKAKKDSLRDQYLRQSLSDLDSCLFQFPDAPVADKVRRNRALVEKELHR